MMTKMLLINKYSETCLLWSRRDRNLRPLYGGDHFIEGHFELFRDLGAQIQGHCNEATTLSEGHYIEVLLYSKTRLQPAA